MSKALITEAYLTDIADAIRAKNGSSDTYTPPQMSAAIAAIPTGGITPTGTKNITQNGTHDVTQYASANVNVQPNLQTKTATQNGTVTPDQGYDGLSSVTVNVSGGGTYELLEYIESNGTQGIDTGIKIHNNDVMSVNVMALSGNDQYRWVCSVCYDASSYGGILYASGVTRAYYANGTSVVLYNGIDTASENRYSVKIANSSESPNNAFLFAYNDGTIYNFSKARLYRAMIAGHLFIPVRRKSDNVCGMYDTTSKAFKTDAAGGDPFVAGPAIEL